MIEQAIEIARGCLNTPFRHQGRVPGRALDCAGLIVHVVKELGLSYKDLHGYSRIPHEGKLKQALDLQPCFDLVSSAERGDVLLMRFNGEPTHVALFTGDTIIHAYEQAGKVCEHGLDETWKSRIVAVYRLKDNE